MDDTYPIAMAEYLYALPVGLWPQNIDAFEIMSLWPEDKTQYRLHVKLGSSAREEEDVVDKLHYRYGTPLGRPQLWWLEPSANAIRDERNELFRYFAERRVWRDREIFWFASKQEFDTMISTFTTNFRTLTIDEDADKPALPRSIDRRISAEQQRKDRVKRQKEQRIQNQLEEKRAEKAQQNEQLDEFLESMTVKDANGFVREKELNALLKEKNIQYQNVRGGMKDRGYIFTCKNIQKKSIPVYKGLRILTP